MLVDEIAAAYSESPVHLTVKVLPEDDAGGPSVLLQGNARALRLVAMLLLAMSEEIAEDGFAIHPNGAGCVHFSREATHGIYIQKQSE